MPLVYDLHFEKLTGRLPAKNEIPLETQMIRAKLILQKHARQYGNSIILIHGEGEGVLKQQLQSYIKSRYPSFECEPASYYPYGNAALKVSIKR